MDCTAVRAGSTAGREGEGWGKEGWGREGGVGKGGDMLAASGQEGCSGADGGGGGVENGEGEGMRFCGLCCSERIWGAQVCGRQRVAGETGGENEKAIGKGRKERKSEREEVRLRLYGNDKRTRLWQPEFPWSCNRGGNVGDVETLQKVTQGTLQTVLKCAFIALRRVITVTFGQ